MSFLGTDFSWLDGHEKHELCFKKKDFFSSRWFYLQSLEEKADCTRTRGCNEWLEHCCSCISDVSQTHEGCAFCVDHKLLSSIKE